jgi:hypothetical protein
MRAGADRETVATGRVLKTRTRMKDMPRTIVIVEPGLGFTTEDFAAVWNARAAGSGDAVAAVERRPDSFNADLLTILGNVADFIAVATFVGLPTVREIVHMLRGKSEEPAEALEIEDTTVDVNRAQIRKIVIRRRRG